uniref:Uncharacterized protein n=1 Tax=Micrurus spixii TaxID=129469 RepID=A0A2D4NDA2_9SAUR
MNRLTQREDMQIACLLASSKIKTFCDYCLLMPGSFHWPVTNSLNEKVGSKASWNEAWKKLQAQIVMEAKNRALECSGSLPWHPHSHYLLFFHKVLEESKLASINCFCLLGMESFCLGFLCF